MKLVQLSTNLSFNPELVTFVKSGRCKSTDREYVAIYFGGHEQDDHLTITGHEIPAFVEWWEKHVDTSYMTPAKKKRSCSWCNRPPHHQGWRYCGRHSFHNSEWFEEWVGSYEPCPWCNDDGKKWRPNLAKAEAEVRQ